MDISYRMDSPQQRHTAADLEITLLGGDQGQGTRKKPPRLNTARLKAFRQVTRGAILSILETGHVSVELVKRQGDRGRVVELFVVSGDGQEICLERTNRGDDGMSDSGGDVGDGEQTWKTFTYDTIPEKYWKKYSHAYRFVNLVKSKTAKVTMYSERAKGVLMENSPPNFEASFFNGGPRILMVGNEVHIKEESGASLIFHRDSLNNLVNNYTMELIQHATQMKEQCLRLEASVMTVQAMSHNNEPLFPVTVGARPSTSFCSSTSSNSGSMDLLSSPHLHPSPPGSQGQPFSPPPSPVPHLDLRFPETPRKFVPTPHSSPAPDRSGSVTSESPLRHVSTLEGRRMRRQIPSDSSFLDGNNAPHSAGTYLRQYTPRQCVPNPLEEQDSAQQVSTGHALANSQVFGAAAETTKMDSNPHFMTSTPCRAAMTSSSRLAQAQAMTSPGNFITPSVPSSSSPSSTVAAQNRPTAYGGGVTHAGCDAFCDHPAQPGSPHGLLHHAPATEDQQNSPAESTPYPNSYQGIPAAPALRSGQPATTSSDGTGPAPNRAGVSAASRSPEPSSGAPTDSWCGSEGVDAEQGGKVVRQAFVAYTGWVTQLANGTIWVRYNDGTQLGVNPRNRTELVYVDQDTRQHRYLQSDRLPEIVKQKLEKLPTVINSLYTRPAPGVIAQ